MSPEGIGLETSVRNEGRNVLKPALDSELVRCLGREMGPSGESERFTEEGVRESRLDVELIASDSLLGDREKSDDLSCLGRKRLSDERGRSVLGDTVESEIESGVSLEDVGGGSRVGVVEYCFSSERFEKIKVLGAGSSDGSVSRLLYEMRVSIRTPASRKEY